MFGFQVAAGVSGREGACAENYCQKVAQRYRNTEWESASRKSRRWSVVRKLVSSGAPALTSGIWMPK